MDKKSAFCRTCLKKDSNSNYKSMSTENSSEEAVTILEMLSFCIPELDLQLVKDPFICLTCLDLLKFAFEFKRKCLVLEEKFMNYLSKYSLKQVELDYFCKNIPPKKNTQQNSIKKPVIFREKLNQTSDVSKKEKSQKNTQNLSTKNCQGCTMNSRNPVDHIRSTKSDFQCYGCLETFDNLTNLRKHIYTKHIYLRACHICGKTARDNNMLTVHLRTHTKEKPFDCQHCGKKFRQRYALKEHILTHDKAENNTNKCHVCGRIMSTKYNLKIHLNRHFDANPKCEECGKGFYTQAAHDKHSLICRKKIDESSENEVLIKVEEDSIENDCDIKIENENEIFLPESSFIEFKYEDNVEVT